MDETFSSQPGAVSAQGGRLQPGAVDDTPNAGAASTTVPVIVHHLKDQGIQ